MRKTLLLTAQGGKNWIGGLYYVKNMAFQLSLNEAIARNYNILICVNRENYTIFSNLPSNIYVKRIEFSKGVLNKIPKFAFYKANNVKYVFPFANSSKLAGVKAIRWIADFQHYHFPDLFSERELVLRRKRDAEIAQMNNPLILSSYDSKRDFLQYCKVSNDNIYIVPFVSYIEPEIQRIRMCNEQDILNKYGLYGIKYACISNQFWQHKNHIVVLRAIKELGNMCSDFKFIFTGLPKDQRNPKYFQSLMELLEDSNVKEHIEILGFIDRFDQLMIMKNSEFIIQPSLFEGWGTVVEDAKVLDKTILLSDIPVHREQRNDKCILFDPYNPKELASLIEIEISKIHIDNIEAGIADMYRRAMEYSEGFERLLSDQERKYNE